MTTLATTLADLSHEYLALHVPKEDLFWADKMGLGDDAEATSRAYAQAEIAWNSWLQDPARLKRLRDLDAQNQGSEAERHTLRGWVSMLAAHVVEDPAARALSERIVEAEQALQRARGAMTLGFVDPKTGQLERASSVKLMLMMRSDPDAARREAAYRGLLSIEEYVLEHGFLELVAQRNQLARTLGHADFYAWRLAVVERMTKDRLFGLLGNLEERTRAHANAQLSRFVEEKGAAVRQPWNFHFLNEGALSRQLDPYFRFDESLSRWARAFTALGVRYQGATLTLDLVDRRGKYENGFMHGPEPTYLEAGRLHPARIQFTANAVPGAVGSGLKATETLFHEGGHAAHFANITEGAPCFSMEFAPTSVAYAETQSMFMDSLLGDPDFRVRYALDAKGAAMPEALVLEATRQRQPLKAFEVRMLMTVPFAERALYEMSDAERTPRHVLATFRRVERELQGLDAGVRPMLAVPHLLAGESSAYYHGYVLAELAVQTTRAFFLQRDGHLTDNPRVGPDLARAYWQRGNALTFDETLARLTGKGLTADALVGCCNRGVDEALAETRACLKAAQGRPPATGPIALDAKVRVVHGKELIAESSAPGDFEKAASKFAKWVRTQEPAAP
jgi:oligoendopeptidase F